MDARLNMMESPIARKVVGHLITANRQLNESTLPPATQRLVEIRTSQINGCGYCTDMHTKDALYAGETQERLNMVAAWREATVFNEAERAALELAEQGARLADTPGAVSDAAWEEATRHYDDEQLAALVSRIAVINAFNRANVMVRQPAGDYQPGQFD